MLSWFLEPLLLPLLVSARFGGGPASAEPEDGIRTARPGGAPWTKGAATVGEHTYKGCGKNAYAGGGLGGGPAGGRSSELGVADAPDTWLDAWLDTDSTAVVMRFHLRNGDAASVTGCCESNPVCAG